MPDDGLDSFFSRLREEDRKANAASSGEESVSSAEERADAVTDVAKDVYVEGERALRRDSARVQAIRERDHVFVSVTSEEYGDVRPIVSFRELEKSARGAYCALARRLKAAGIEKPAFIQKHVIPIMLRGHDVIGISETGTGKTAAFLVPLFIHLLWNSAALALVLVPTRELAIQTYRSARALSVLGKNKTCLVSGGTDIVRAVRDTKAGARVLVATPGRMASLENMLGVMQRVSLIVFDETDNLFDAGFMPAIERLVEKAHRSCQKVFFSATLSKKAEEHIKKISAHHYKVVSKSCRIVWNIKADVVVVHAAEKQRMLLALLVREEKTVVFAENGDSVNEIAVFLRRNRFRAFPLHAGIDQHERCLYLDSFRKMHFGVLVATALGSRGLHFDAVDRVVNYDVPHTIEDFVHKAGRTGRFREGGRCTTLFCPESEERYVFVVCEVFARSNIAIDSALLALAKQALEKIEAGKLSAPPAFYRGKRMQDAAFGVETDDLGFADVETALREEIEKIEKAVPPRMQ